jgi:protein-disulfide isomerase
VVHIANFCFLGVVEFSPVADAGNGRRALGWAAAAFVVVTGLQVGGLVVERAKGEQQVKESLDEIIKASHQPQGEPFTGRYRLGPADAPIRLVVFSDFQCPDCRRFEQQVRSVFAERTDMSVSHKHHPFCSDCNPFVKRNMHPNACWAARAAEAAGMLRGNDGFWHMHRWLFDRGGSFTDAEIKQALAGFGYDVAEFIRVMQSPETLELVQADIFEARDLGIHRTPMVFINGVELRGWHVPTALKTAVERLAATNPPRGTPEQDRPEDAFDKYVTDWRLEQAFALPPDVPERTIGPADAAADVVLWGDYEEPITGSADRLLRGILAKRDDMRYTFRHYPINESCNSVAARTLHAHACDAAKAAEAAGTLGGDEGYWAMHEWIMANQRNLGDEALLQAAVELGYDETAFLAAMNSPEAARAITVDATAGKRMGLTGVPLIYVNGKKIPRWRKEGVLDAIIEEAANSS